MIEREQNKAIFKFSLQLIVTMLAAFLLHWIVLYFYNYSFQEAHLLSTYSSNTILALVIVGLILRFQHAVRNHIGFLFLAGSTLKIAVFFIVFRPLYMIDGEVSTLERIGFIVPYLISLFLETRSLVRFLNS